MAVRAPLWADRALRGSAAGGNATELLGHSSRKITLAYLDPRICRKHSAVDVLFRPGQ